MTQSVYAYISLANAVTSLALAVFVLFKNWRSTLNRSFSFFAFNVAFWAFNYFLWLTMKDGEKALFYIRLAMAGAIMIPVAFVDFTFRLTNKDGRLITIINIFLAFVWLLFSFTPFYILSVEKRLVFEYWPVPGPLFHFMFIHFIFNTVFSHFLLWRSLEKDQGSKTNQIRYVFLGTLIGFVGGSTNYFLWYGVLIPPYLNFLVSVYIFTVAYAILKYKLMDIQVILKRTLVFAGLLAFVFGIFSFGLFVSQEVLSRYFGFKWEIALAISIFLIVLGYEPMRAFLIETTDKYLFQKKYDYQKFLKDATRGIAQIESLQHLLGLVTHFITMRMRLKNAAVLIRDLKEGQFYLAHKRGYSSEFSQGHTLLPRSSLIRYLDHKKEAIEIEQVKSSIEAETKKPKKEEATIHLDFTEIKREMEELNATCCVPSFLGRELRNILILGEKKSGEFYSQEDLNVLFTLAQESAIAIENARLYDEAVNRTRELQKINEELEMARTRLTHALDQTEKANRELQNTQAQLIHEQKMATLGRLAASVGHEVNNPLTILSMNVSRALLKHRKDPELKVGDILEIFQKMEQNITRIKAVVNTLTGLLKKSEKGKFEPLSLKLILEETLPLVQFQTYLDNPTGTDVEFDVPSSIPLIRGDLERLQEVFLNLFINAFHAMSGKKNRRIEVHAHLSGPDQKMVEVDFADNGSGMTEETQKKIFTYGFTTKGPGRGSGMGLYICKYIIELHGGEMKVKSQLGVGTTFTLTIPAYEEQSPTGVPGGAAYSTS